MGKSDSFEALAIVVTVIVVMTIWWIRERAIVKCKVPGMAISLTIGGNGGGLILGEEKDSGHWVSGTAAGITREAQYYSSLRAIRDSRRHIWLFKQLQYARLLSSEEAYKKQIDLPMIDAVGGG
ncbi:hypothetical protein BS47DRAFT_602208 [Hydnum rufescens UP504]|uniref:Uncharacterized protein n=1 Tax=Hydnum rufescens UP504 TaxID=1448309 RepID=A0A9P6B2Y5_9AGAM|nr:hypothetical protein BS47DRAFT_602208 [Hydnum rufescens UP504]